MHVQIAGLCRCKDKILEESSAAFLDGGRLLMAGKKKNPEIKNKEAEENTEEVSW